MTQLEGLTPGITYIFSRIGWKATATEDPSGQISITVSKGPVSQTRLFPYPTINSDLSGPLLLWRNTLEASYP